jgi:hypothetical protein
MQLGFMREEHLYVNSISNKKFFIISFRSHSNNDIFLNLRILYVVVTNLQH